MCIVSTRRCGCIEFLSLERIMQITKRKSDLSSCQTQAGIGHSAPAHRGGHPNVICSNLLAISERDCAVLQLAAGADHRTWATIAVCMGSDRCPCKQRSLPACATVIAHGPRAWCTTAQTSPPAATCRITELSHCHTLSYRTTVHAPAGMGVPACTRELTHYSRLHSHADPFFGRSWVRFRVPPWVSNTIARDHLA